MAIGKKEEEEVDREREGSNRKYWIEKRRRVDEIKRVE